MKYIAFYDTEEYRSENRAVAPAAADVVRYMSEVFGECGPVEIISPARTLHTKGRFKGRKTDLGGGVSLVVPPTFGAGNPLGRLLAIVCVRWWLFFYLLFHTRRHETVVAYHSLSYISIIRWIKRIKKLFLIEEVREIYSDVADEAARQEPKNKKQRKKEFCFFGSADRFIFPTELLNEAVNLKKKPYLIAAGVYRAEERISDRKDDGKIHVVYAGTLDPKKGGALAAVETANYLPANYHIHILGYGTEEMIADINRKIAVVAQNGGAEVSYDGVLRGRDFAAFLQSCHIGLSTQDPNRAFSATSFPSKILVYFSNDLNVVSCRIRAVEDSAVGAYVQYYDKQEPETIAQAILQIDLRQSGSKREILDRIDRDLKKEMVAFLKSDKAGERPA